VYRVNREGQVSRKEKKAKQNGELENGTGKQYGGRIGGKRLSVPRFKNQFCTHARTRQVCEFTKSLLRFAIQICRRRGGSVLGEESCMRTSDEYIIHVVVLSQEMANSVITEFKNKTYFGMYANSYWYNYGGHLVPRTYVLISCFSQLSNIRTFGCEFRDIYFLIFITAMFSNTTYTAKNINFGNEIKSNRMNLHN